MLIFLAYQCPRDDAIATRGNLRLNRTNKRFEGAMRDLLLNKTFIQHYAGEKTIKTAFIVLLPVPKLPNTRGYICDKEKDRDYLFLHRDAGNSH